MHDNTDHVDRGLTPPARAEKRFEDFDRVWFLTWTTYGTWLPGDQRGFVSPKFESASVEPRHNVPGTPVDAGRRELRERAQKLMKGPAVLLTAEQAAVLRGQFERTAEYRGWRLVAGAVMSNHVHLLVGVRGDPEPAELLRDFKAYGSRALNAHTGRPASGTWWTEQGSRRRVSDGEHFLAVLAYVERQPEALVTWREA